MMGTNAIEHAEADLLRRVVAAGRDASAADVVWLLRGAWRPRVMGAWFSLLHDSEAVTLAVLQSLETSHGSLTAPPLAVAAVVLANHEAQSALAAYVAQDVLHGWGSAAFVGAAMEQLGTRAPMEVSQRDRSDFEQMHAIAEAVREPRGPRLGLTAKDVFAYRWGRSVIVAGDDRRRLHGPRNRQGARSTRCPSLESGSCGYCALRCSFAARSLSSPPPWCSAPLPRTPRRSSTPAGRSRTPLRRAASPTSRSCRTRRRTRPSKWSSTATPTRSSPRAARPTATSSSVPASPPS